MNHPAPQAPITTKVPDPRVWLPLERKISHEHHFQQGSGPSFYPRGAAGLGLLASVLEVLAAVLVVLAAGHCAGC